MDSQEPQGNPLNKEKMPVTPKKRPFYLSISFLFSFFILALLVYRMVGGTSPAPKEIPYSEFKVALTEGKIASVLVGTTSISGKMQDGTAFTTVRVEDPDLTQALEAQKVQITGQVDSNGGILGFLLTWVFPVVLIAGLWFFLMRRSKGGAGSLGSVFSFGKSKARVIQGE
ncbi:MAG: ATP-dependent metallopeptidase FtsH/Yme1/Tma family protein [Omnitrophica WOR_2 bacterium]